MRLLKQNKSSRVLAIARQGIHPTMWRVQADQLQRVIRHTRTRRSGHALVAGMDVTEEQRLLLELCAAIRRLLRSDVERLEQLGAAQQRFSAKYSAAQGDGEKQAYIIEFARELGAGRKQIKGDRRAFRRWFGVDAINDRYADEVGRIERFLSFGLERLGEFAAAVVSRPGVTVAQAELLWRHLDLEKSAFRLTRYDGDRRIQAAAALALAHGISALPLDMQQQSMSDQSIRRIYRACVDRGDDVWVQIAAITLLRRAAPETFWTVAKIRLREPGEDGDIFVRRAILRLFEEAVPEQPALVDLLPKLREDPSPHVRQGVGLAALHAPNVIAIPLFQKMCLEDSESAVRAANFLAITQHAGKPSRIGEMQQLIVQVLQCEQDEFAMRCGLRAAESTYHFLLDKHPEHAAEWRRAVCTELEAIHAAPDRQPAVKRHAARALERFWCAGDDAARQLLQQIRSLLTGMVPGSSRRLPRGFMTGVATEKLGRVLAIAAQDDFGLEVWRAWDGWRLARGDHFRPRLWRILHELRLPASDKRQAHSHVVGRVYRGAIIAPSARMGELSKTRVPGEPLVIGSEGNWRPYLPLPDQCLSAIDSGSCVRLFTAEGVTEIHPPRGLLGQLRARFRLVFAFEKIADQRNWQADSGQPPDQYASSMRRLGVEIRLRGYENGGYPADPGVTQFFAVTPLLFGEELLRRFEQYVFSFYENTLLHLLIFSLAIGSYFFGRHLWMNALIRRARSRIGLVVGGWGTRGKSGTERLKAAMFNALGFGMVSKTTGCEAMFVMARPFRPLRELFLFRPYDKATIWEQHNLAVLSTRLDAEVFLWECMGLTPAYVKILQRQWMRDDVSTITNTYPDHEDLQGPAGYDIPTVMINFIPEGGHLITSEEEMRPILSTAARDLKSAFTSVGWLESGMLAEDVLSRFPYAEHPTNIALVLALASELGIPRDFALKEMADRVVPDLGVLKSYAPAELQGRRLVFINGMSANERFGCMGNWKRMGFQDHDCRADPGTWLVTVVNNRADREPRSKVFASILARDTVADAHVLIGSNLEGLQSFLRDEWEARMKSVSLWGQDQSVPASGPEALAEFRIWVKRMRLPSAESDIEARLAVMRERLSLATDGDFLELVAEARPELSTAATGFVTQQRDWLATVQELDKTLSEIPGQAEATLRAQLDAQFLGFLSQVFFARIHVVEDYHASGNAVIDAVCSQVPPGMLAKVMGMQNIKGTGLDFVYRWQAWERCHALCTQLLSGRSDQVVEALRGLATFAEYAPVSELHVRDTLQTFRGQKLAQSETAQAQMQIIEENLQRQVDAVRGKLQAAGDDAGQGGTLQRWRTQFVDGVEQFLDSGDAVRRRRRADLIYRELATQRISQDRAIQELQALNRRQKGGWLRQRLRGEV